MSDLECPPAENLACFRPVDFMHLDEARIQAVVRAVAQHYAVPCCFIALHAEGDELLIKARFGMEIKTLPGSAQQQRLGAHFVNRHCPVIVPDTNLVHWCKEEPLVVGPPYARFYVGAPLVTRDGKFAGSICIIDREPRPAFSLNDCAMLEEAASKLVNQLATGLGEDSRQWKSFTVGNLPTMGDAVSDESLPELSLYSCGASDLSECLEGQGKVKTNASLLSMSSSGLTAAPIYDVVRNVAKHYGVSCCFIALHSPNELRLQARLGVESKLAPIPTSEQCIGHHFTQRDAPIVVTDTELAPWCKEDMFVTGPPYARFYVGAPLLLLGGTTCVGTLCILDSRPRVDFVMQDALALEEAAARLVDLLLSQLGENFSEWRSHTLGSLPTLTEASLPEIDDM
eukprot:TRINITY_DN31944_c0_g1_i1.p1 TRINITY_DN31944_c0_g1~~TRINITY_DN31944_c0_g1_i1.p1  ORF type:complete len:399 (-),score=45.83 TRINITY_DN31944_c0_g1_i1:725-1921(-)